MNSKNNISRESFIYKQNEKEKKQVENIIKKLNNGNKTKNSNNKKDK